MILVPILFIVVGVALIVWPDKVRKYDQALTRLIKTRDEYCLVVRSLGGFFILMGLLSLISMLTGSMK